MKHFDRQIGFEVGRFGLWLAAATDLWWLKVPTTLPSKEYKVYQLIGSQLKVYDEMFVFSVYLLFFKFTLAWFRK